MQLGMSGQRRRVLRLHREALRGADPGTAEADDAAQPVDLPDLLLRLHADGLRRARALTGPTGERNACPMVRRDHRSYTFFLGPTFRTEISNCVSSISRMAR